MNPRSGKQHTHLATKTWLPDALLHSCPHLEQSARAGRARSQRLPDALLWPLKFAENLSFRSASVVTHMAPQVRAQL